MASQFLLIRHKRGENQVKAYYVFQARFYNVDCDATRLSTCAMPHARREPDLQISPRWFSQRRSNIGTLQRVFTLRSRVLRFSEIQSPCLTLGLMSNELLWARLSCCRLPGAHDLAESHINIQCKTLQIHCCLQIGFPSNTAFNGRKHFVSYKDGSS